MLQVKLQPLTCLGIAGAGVIKVNAQGTKYGNVKTAVANGKEISNLMIGAAIASQAKLLAPVDYGQLKLIVSFNHQEPKCSTIWLVRKS